MAGYNKEVAQAYQDLQDQRANLPGSSVQGDVLTMPTQGDVPVQLGNMGDPYADQTVQMPPQGDTTGGQQQATPTMGTSGLDIPLGASPEDVGNFVAAQDRQASIDINQKLPQYIEREAEESAQIGGTTLSDMAPHVRERMNDGIRMGLRGQDAVDYANARLSDQEVKKLTGRTSAPSAAIPPPQGTSSKQLDEAIFAGGAKPKPAAKGRGGGGAPAMPQVAGISPRMIGYNPENEGQPATVESGAAPQAAGAVEGEGGEFGLHGPFAMEGRGAMLKATAESEGAEIEGAQAKKRADYLDKWNEEARKKSELRDSAINQHMAHIQELNADLANTSIDSNRFWKSKNTGQKVLLTLGAALGGFATGFTHGPNQAMEFIQKQMDADIDAQKADIENKRSAVNTEHGLLGDLYKRFGNMEQAEMAYRDITLQKMSEETKGLMAGSQSKTALANGAMMLGAIGERQEASDIKKNEYYDNLAFKMATRKGRGGGGGASDKEVAAYEKELESHNVLGVREAVRNARAGIAANDAGLNPLTQHVGWDPREAARANQANLAELRAQFAKSIGRFSPGTTNQVTKLLSSGSKEDVLHGLDIIEKANEAHIRSVSAAHPNAASTYWGRMNEDPFARDQPQQQQHAGYSTFKPVGGQ